MLLRRFALVALISLSFWGCSSDSGTADTATQPDTQVPADVADAKADTNVPDLAKDNAVPDFSADLPVEPDVVVVPDVPVEPDGFHTDVSPKGFAESCLTGADCAQYGLSCFRYGPQDPEPICSKMCETYMDCPKYFVCDYKYGYADPLKVCRPAVYCSECEDDVQCEYSGMKCISHGKGGKFCSEMCQPGVLSCPGGALCEYVEANAAWMCVPAYGSCKGDGGACSPCKVESDCQTPKFHCAESFYSKERFCVKECASGNECPENQNCFDVGGSTGICYMTFEGQFVPTCHIQTQGFCRECRGHYECEPGNICYTGPGGTGFYCTPECKNSSECPGGTTCKGSFSLETGSIDKYGCMLQDGVTCQYLLENPAE